MGVDNMVAPDLVEDTNGF